MVICAQFAHPHVSCLLKITCPGLQFVKGFTLGLPLRLPWTPYGRAMNARQDIMRVLEEKLQQLVAEMQAQQQSGQAPNGRLTALQAFINATDDQGNRVPYEDVKVRRADSLGTWFLVPGDCY